MPRRKGIKGDPKASYYDAGGIQVMNFKGNSERDAEKLAVFSRWLNEN